MKILVPATLALLLVSAILSNTVLFRQAVQGTTDLTRGLPGSLGAWHVIDESTPSENEFQGLETRDMIKRVYSDGQHSIELVVAYIAHSSRKSAHAQEACLRGSGTQVGTIFRKQLERSPVSATVIEINSANRVAWVYYWYKMGSEFTSDYLKSSFKMFVGGLLGRKAGGTSLIRLLTPSYKGEKPEAIHARLESFTAVLLPELQARLP